jgi:hypothetical protein
MVEDEIRDQVLNVIWNKALGKTINRLGEKKWQEIYNIFTTVNQSDHVWFQTWAQVKEDLK